MQRRLKGLLNRAPRREPETRTLRRTLFQAYLWTLLGIFAPLALGGWLSYMRASEINRVLKLSQQLERKITSARNFESQFLVEDLKNPDFHKNLASKSLDQDRAHDDEIRSLIQQLGFALHGESQASLARVVHTFEEEEKSFEELRSALSRMGHGDWGLFGRWRAAIHRVEASVAAGGGASPIRSRLFELRQSEKNILLRVDEARNLAKHREGCEFLRANLTKRLVPALEDYRAAFDEYLSLRRRSGLSGYGDGLLQKVEGLHKVILSDIAVIQASIVAREKRLVWEIVAILLMTLGISALAGYYSLRHWREDLEDPILRLMRSVNQYSPFDQGTAIPIAGQALSELKALAKSFNEMGDRLSRTVVSKQELVASQQLLDSILSSITDGITTLDSDGRIVYVNLSACRIFGEKDPRALVGRKMSEILGGFDFLDDQGGPLDLARLPGRSLLQGLAKPPLTFQYRRKDGQAARRWATTHALPIRGADGSTKLVISVFRDITEQRELEQTVLRHQAQLAATARLSALGEMAAGVAHEINNPLSVIRRRAEQIDELLAAGEGSRPEGQEAVARYAGKIVQLSDRINRIIQSLRRNARNADHDDFVLVPVQQVVDDAFELCGERFKIHGVQLELLLREPELKVRCRPSEISQILLNLLNNAFDAVESARGPTRKVVLEAGRDRSFLEMRVLDTGPGVEIKNRDKIGIPFFTTKAAGKGTGLGLSLSLRMAQEHGGSLELDPGSPETCFVLRLPLEGPRPVQAA